jgi:single-stranded-DNA-specific exonuclease
VVVGLGGSVPPLRIGPTLLLDDQRTAEQPEGLLHVSSAQAEPVAPTSLLTYFLGAPLGLPPELEWLALLGTLADVGPEAPFPGFKDALKRHGRIPLQDLVSLLNGARRAADFDVARAVSVLVRAETATEIARGRVEGTDWLRSCREQVQAEVKHWARLPPRIEGRMALVVLSSRADVHPLLALRWAQQLPEHVILVANTGLKPGQVHYALRSKSEPDVRGLLRQLPLAPMKGTLVRGPRRAPTGHLSAEDFQRLLLALGFSQGAQEAGADAGV